MNSKAAAILLALLFVGTAVAIQPTDDQETVIKAVLNNDGPNGEDDLQSEWQTKVERHRLYLRDDGTAKYFGCSGGSSNPNRCRDSYATLYNPLSVLGTVDPELDLQPSGPAVFTYGTTTLDTPLLELNAELFISSQALDTPLARSPTIQVQLLGDGQPIPGANAFEITPDLGSLPTLPDLYPFAAANTYLLTIDQRFVEPVIIPAGVELQIEITADAGPNSGPIQLIYDRESYDDFLGFFTENLRSNVELVAESIHMQLWAENIRGEEQTVFPLAEQASAGERTVQFSVSMINGLGDRAIVEQPHTLRLFGEDGTLHFERGTTAFGDHWWGYQSHSPGDLTPSGDGIFQTYYSLAYPETFDANGEFTFVASNALGEWSFEDAINIGGGSFEFSLLDTESAVKEVYLDSLSQFHFSLENTGSIKEDVVISVDYPDLSWGVDVVPGTLIRDVLPGEIREITVTVTPPPLVSAVDSLTIDVHAKPVHGIQDLVETIEVDITDEKQFGVALLGNIRDVEIAPGESRTFHATIRNEGNLADRFLLTPSNVPLGWSVVAQPPLADIYAQSQETINVVVTAPVTAQRGEEFDLKLTASRVLDAADIAERTVPVRVFLEDKFSFYIQAPSVDGVPSWIDQTSPEAPAKLTLRDEGPDATPESATLTDLTASQWDANEFPDKDFDDSTVFTMILANEGDTDDTIVLEPRWGSLSGIVYSDNNGPCDGSTNHPAGWRVRYFDDGTLPGAYFGGSSDAMFTDLSQEFEVPAGEYVRVYAELKWQTDSATACPAGPQDAGGALHNLPVRFLNDGTRGDNPAPESRLRIEAYSTNNPTNRNIHYLTAALDNTVPTRLGENQYTQALRDVSLELNEYQVDLDLSKDISIESANAAHEFPIRVINHGNEMDVLRIAVPKERSGWQTSLTIDEDASRMFNNDVAEGHDQGGLQAGCTSTEIEGDDLVIYCTMGSGDFAIANVKVAPTNQVSIGDAEVFKVKVVSMDSVTDAIPGSIQDNLDLSVRAVGSFALDLLPNTNLGTINVEGFQGDSFLVPLDMQNLGTTDALHEWSFAGLPEEWNAVLSHGGKFLIPAGETLHGFMQIQIPANAEPGSLEQLFVTLQNDFNSDQAIIQVNVLEAQPEIVAAAHPLGDLVAGFNDEIDAAINVTRIGGDAADVRFEVNQPDNSGIQINGLPSIGNFDSEGSILQGFTVATGTEVASSRIPFTIDVYDGTQLMHQVPYVVSFFSGALGFDLELLDTPIVVPGGSTEFDLTIVNHGLSTDAVRLQIVDIPSEWTLGFENELVPLPPLGTVTAKLTVSAPTDVVQGNSILATIEAKSVGDAGISEQIAIPVQVGVSQIALNATPDQVFIGPLETKSQVVSVSNVGVIADTLQLATAVDESIEGLVSASVEPSEVQLLPGESADLLVTYTGPANLAGGTVIEYVILASSSQEELQGIADATITATVLDFKAADIDGDGNLEYATDVNRLEDGFEVYTDPNPVGAQSSAPNLVAFLTEAAIEEKTENVTINGEETNQFTYFIDGDEDGRLDHFLDTDGDQFPNVYWSPARNHFQVIEVTKDLTGDGILEVFLDVTGNGILDLMFDFSTGTFTDLLKVDADEDGHFDYIVDVNANGVGDVDEPVLFAQLGRIVSVLEFIDVDGDGNKDSVFDEDGDGNPDSFTPHGTERGIQIVLRDVNGDGSLDWAFDANEDGRIDSFYDPSTGESGVIDTTASFQNLVRDYWYVAALFGLVLVLFVVLIGVTRRQ